MFTSSFWLYKGEPWLLSFKGNRNCSLQLRPLHSWLVHYVKNCIHINTKTTHKNNTHTQSLPKKILTETWDDECQCKITLTWGCPAQWKGSLFIMSTVVAICHHLHQSIQITLPKDYHTNTQCTHQQTEPSNSWTKIIPTTLHTHAQHTSRQSPATAELKYKSHCILTTQHTSRQSPANTELKAYKSHCTLTTQHTSRQSPANTELKAYKSHCTLTTQHTGGQWVGTLNDNFFLFAVVAECVGLQAVHNFGGLDPVQHVFLKHTGSCIAS